MATVSKIVLSVRKDLVDLLGGVILYVAVPRVDGDEQPKFDNSWDRQYKETKGDIACVKGEEILFRQSIATMMRELDYLVEVAQDSMYIYIHRYMSS